MLCTPNQILHSCAQIKKNELDGARSTYGGEERCRHVLVGRHKGKKNTWKIWHRCANSIKMDHQEVGCESLAWINVAQDRDRLRALVSAVINIRNP